MNRVKIEIPATLPFSTKTDLRITDINYGNHLGNQVFLELMHEARARFLFSIGYTELRFDEAALIMGDASIEFKAEVLYGDEIEIQLGVKNCSRVGFELLYLVLATRDKRTFVAAKARTGMICYDYELKKVTGLSDQARERLQKFNA